MIHNAVEKRGFDVICAGDAFLNVAGRDGGSGFRPGGGAISAALAVAAEGLRVGLVTVFRDDRRGRALLARVAEKGIDVGGVVLDKPSGGIVFVRGGARQVVSVGEEDAPIEVPEGWSSQVLLLSGMSPVVSHGAALCKAARAARRAGTIVVVDVNARWDLWKGRDSRAIRMVLREADVVWCTSQDLFGLDMDVRTLRASLRKTAVLVWSDGAGHTSATGPLLEVTHTRGGSTPSAPLAEGDAFTAAICCELARAGHTDASGGALWARALRRGHAAVAERAAR
jgi:2-dehydro-3-deoxygluconokinase